MLRRGSQEPEIIAARNGKIEPAEVTGTGASTRKAVYQQRIVFHAEKLQPEEIEAGMARIEAYHVPGLFENRLVRLDPGEEYPGRHETLVDTLPYLFMQQPGASYPSEYVSRLPAVAGGHDIGVGRSMAAMPRKDFGEEHNAVEGGCGEGQYHVVTAIDGKGCRVGHEGQQPPGEEGGMTGKNADKNHAQEVAVGYAVIECHGGVAVVKRPGETGTHEFVADGLHLPFDFARLPNVVLVGNGDVVARGLGEGIEEISVYPFARFVLPGVYVRIAAGIFAHDVIGAVGRCIILYDYFIRGIGLCHDGVELFAYERLPVTSAHDYRHSFLLHGKT